MQVSLNPIMKTFIILIFSLASSLSPAEEKLFKPTNPKIKAPLFVALHGCLSNPQDMERISRLSEYAEAHGFYVLYPEPELGPDSLGCFNFYTEESQRRGGGDGAAIVSKVQALLATYDIDPQKVFVVGMSGGASLISVLTSCYPEVFAGAAIHSGMGYGLASGSKEALLVAATGPKLNQARNEACSPESYQGKIFLIQGSMDPVMNPRHFSLLRKDYLQDAKSMTRIVPPTLKRFGYEVEEFFRKEQLVGKTVYVHGLNHEWSGTKSSNPLVPLGPDATWLMVNFLLGRDAEIRN